eukprot:7982953-Heterocapsa_arctica.AAC.1
MLGRELPGAGRPGPRGRPGNDRRVGDPENDLEHPKPAPEVGEGGRGEAPHGGRVADPSRGARLGNGLERDAGVVGQRIVPTE